MPLTLGCLVTILLTINATITELDLCSYQTKILIHALNATKGHKCSYPTSY